MYVQCAYCAYYTVYPSSCLIHHWNHHRLEKFQFRVISPALVARCMQRAETKGSKQFKQTKIKPKPLDKIADSASEWESESGMEDDPPSIPEVAEDTKDTGRPVVIPLTPSRQGMRTSVERAFSDQLTQVSSQIQLLSQAVSSLQAAISTTSSMGRLTLSTPSSASGKSA